LPLIPFFLLIRSLPASLGLCALLPLVLSVSARADASGCPASGAARASVRSVTERLEIGLADGRQLRLAGLEAPDATPDDAELGGRSRAFLEAKLAGKEIAFEILSQKPDRWGRFPAMVFAGTDGVSLAEELLENGLARLVPDQVRIACETRYQAAEARARKARPGLWQDAYYALLGTQDRDAFAEHAGSFIQAEGKLTDVKAGPTRTYLIFGPRRRGHLVVTVLQRNVKNFENAGLQFKDLIGQTLHVRGLLETRFGPEIEISRPGDLSVMRAE